VILEDGDTGKLRAELSQQPPIGQYELELPARPNRPGRTAQLDVRVAQVRLSLRDRRTEKRSPLTVTAVWSQEHGDVDSLDWLLFTNRPISTLNDALEVIHGYTQRWRVEEAHRTWKTGGCDVEATQLHSFAAIKVWATILAAVAVRVERLKRLGRAEPDAAASSELTPIEVKALVLSRRQNYPRERVPDEPTIGKAVLWIAELGGWAGKYSGKPPGATVLRRGLTHLTAVARGLQIGLELAGSRG
jgi:hypothetical protein